MRIRVWLWLVIAGLGLAKMVDARSNFRGYSGAPGRQTCAISCHGNSGGSVFIDGFPQSYEPGAIYEIEIGRSFGSSINNFNGSVRLGSGTSNAGVLSGSNDTETYNVSGETNGIRLDSNNQNSATFFWTAPGAGAGEARLYIGAYQGTSENSGSTTELTLVSEEGASIPRLELASLAIASDNDQDGILEPGEDAFLVLTLLNAGWGQQTGITGTLSHESEWITLEGETSGWPDLDSGQSAFNVDALGIVVSAEAPSVFTTTLQLDLTTDAGEQSLEFPLDIGAWTGILATDVEAGAGDWIHQPEEGWLDNWHISDESSTSPEHAWKCGSSGSGDYDNLCDTRLVSPMFTALPQSRLRFFHQMEAEISSAFPDSAYDGGIVELSVNDGLSWEQIMPVGGHATWFRWLTGSGNPTTHPFTGGTPCYSGEFDWTEALFDLSPWEGQELRIAFRFASDAGTSREGWYLDDLVIEGVEEDTYISRKPAAPAGFTLHPAQPNPFNPTTLLRYDLDHAGPVRLELYDLAGRCIRLLESGVRPAGSHELNLDGTGLASGLYLLRLETGHGQALRRITLLQ